LRWLQVLDALSTVSESVRATVQGLALRRLIEGHQFRHAEKVRRPWR
jgi:hypothetical protein